MNIYRHHAGFSLIEMLFTLAILSIVATVGFFSFGEFRDGIIVGNVVERLASDIRSLQQKIQHNDVQKVVIVFSREAEKMYWKHVYMLVLDTQKKRAAANLRIDMTGAFPHIVYPSLVDSGSIDVSWMLPEVFDPIATTHMDITTPGKTLFSLPSLLIPDNQTSYTLEGIHYPHITFTLFTPESLPVERLILEYYDERNMGASERFVSLSSLEAKTFSGDWEALSFAEVVFQNGSTKTLIQSSNQQYVSLKIVFDFFGTQAEYLLE